MSNVFDTIQVYDDLVPEDVQDFLYHFFMQNNSVSWFFVENLTGTQKHTEEKTVNNPGLSAPIGSSEKVLLPDAYIFTQSIVNFLQTKNILNFDKIINIRAFLQLPNGNESIMANPHTDWGPDINHTTVLYYINDSDGDTFFIDKTNKDVSIKEIENTNYEVIKKVSPKKGRLVVFDGSIYHGSSSPQYNPRCVVNFNLKNIDVK